MLCLTFSIISLSNGYYRLCNEHGINAYPTSIFFNGSIRHIYSGNHDGESIADFVTDILRPSVTVLNKVNLFKDINDIMDRLNLDY